MALPERRLCLTTKGLSALGLAEGLRSVSSHFEEEHEPVLLVQLLTVKRPMRDPFQAYVVLHPARRSHQLTGLG